MQHFFPTLRLFLPINSCSLHAEAGGTLKHHENRCDCLACLAWGFLQLHSTQAEVSSSGLWVALCSKLLTQLPLPIPLSSCVRAQPSVRLRDPSDLENGAFSQETLFLLTKHAGVQFLKSRGLRSLQFSCCS